MPGKTPGSRTKIEDIKVRTYTRFKFGFPKLLFPAHFPQTIDTHYIVL